MLERKQGVAAGGGEGYSFSRNVEVRKKITRHQDQDIFVTTSTEFKEHITNETFMEGSPMEAFVESSPMRQGLNDGKHIVSISPEKRWSPCSNRR